MNPVITTAAAVGHALALCDHVERFAYERQGRGLDASPHNLSAATRLLVDLLIPNKADRPPPPAAPAWCWWSGPSDEWYEYGPFDTREEALAALGGGGGFIIEAMPGAKVHFDAEQLIDAQYYEDNDSFDYERTEPSRVGPAAAMKVADAELQAILDAWCAKYAHTFRRGTIFSASRNAEQIPADQPAAAAVAGGQ